MRLGSNDTALKVRNNMPGAIHKVGMRRPGHGHSSYTNATYGLDGQFPCATTLGAGRRVMEDWKEGDPIKDTIMISETEAARQRGFPSDYVEFVRQFDVPLKQGDGGSGEDKFTEDKFVMK